MYLSSTHFVSCFLSALCTAVASRYAAFYLSYRLLAALNCGAVRFAMLTGAGFAGGVCCVGSIVAIMAGCRTRYMYPLAPLPTPEGSAAAFSHNSSFTVFSCS